MTAPTVVHAQRDAQQLQALQQLGTRNGSSKAANITSGSTENKSSLHEADCSMRASPMTVICNACQYLDRQFTQARAMTILVAQICLTALSRHPANPQKKL